MEWRWTWFCVSSSVQIGMFHLPFVNPQCSALGILWKKVFVAVACVCSCGQINIGCAGQKIHGSYGRSARDAASAGSISGKSSGRRRQIWSNPMAGTWQYPWYGSSYRWQSYSYSRPWGTWSGSWGSWHDEVKSARNQRDSITGTGGSAGQGQQAARRASCRIQSEHWGSDSPVRKSWKHSPSKTARKQLGWSSGVCSIEGMDDKAFCTWWTEVVHQMLTIHVSLCRSNQCRDRLKGSQQMKARECIELELQERVSQVSALSIGVEDYWSLLFLYFTIFDLPGTWSIFLFQRLWSFGRVERVGMESGRNFQHRRSEEWEWSDHLVRSPGIRIRAVIRATELMKTFQALSHSSIFSDAREVRQMTSFDTSFALMRKTSWSPFSQKGPPKAWRFLQKAGIWRGASEVVSAANDQYEYTRL